MVLNYCGVNEWFSCFVLLCSHLLHVLGLVYTIPAPRERGLIPEYLHHLHQIIPCFSSLYTQIRQQMSSGLLISGSPTMCLGWGHQCQESYLVFATDVLGTFPSPPPKTLSLFTAFPLFMGLCLSCSLGLHQTR